MKNKFSGEEYLYEDFIVNDKIKHRYFVIINNKTFEKRILSSIEEVVFAGKYMANPTILGFKNLNDAKVYLVGPKTPRKHTKIKKKDFYSHKRKEGMKDFFREAEKARKLNSTFISSR